MPETRIERILALGGVIVIIALVGLTIRAERRGHHSAARGRSPAVERARPGAGRSDSPSEPGPAAAGSGRETGGQPGLANVVITASRGDCWLSIHRNAANGKLLFEGTLVRKKSLRFAARRLVVRLGAASNVDLQLNDNLVKHLRGTVDLIVTDGGVQPAS